MYLNKNRIALLLFTIIITIFYSHSVQAGTVVILDENYDILTLGTPLPGWVANHPGLDGTLPVVQNTNFSSSPNGAAVQNDFGVARLFPDVEGILTLEIWMKPKIGSDTNSGIAFIPDGAFNSALSLMVFKNDTDQWFYVDNGSVVPIKAVSSSGHTLRIIYDTSTTEYDLHMDGALIKSGAVWTGGTPGPIEGIWTFSGRGGNGTLSYFDDLLLTLSDEVEQPLLPLILIHGIATNNNTWHKFIGTLIDNGYNFGGNLSINPITGDVNNPPGISDCDGQVPTVFVINYS